MFILLTLVMGLIIGSFLNVLICRLPEGQSIIRPRSRCPHCETPIRFYDNIPVVSYLLLRGRCRDCGMKISWQYPVVEIITALTFLALFFKYGKSAHRDLYAISVVLMLFLIPISFIDIRKRLILNRLTIPGFILGVFLLFGFHYENWKYILFRHLFLGAFVSGLILLLIGILGKVLFRKESLGMGDVKLLVMIGLYVGFPGVLLCLFLGIIAASLFVLWGIIFRKLRFGSTIPFGPFIAVGALVHLLYGDAIISWYAGLIGLTEMGWWGLGGLN